MSTSVRLSAPADPALMKTLEEYIHWRRGEKATSFYVGSEGVSGWTELPFPFRILLNQALCSSSALLRNQGPEENGGARQLYAEVCEVGGFRSGQNVCTLWPGRKPGIRENAV